MKEIPPEMYLSPSIGDSPPKMPHSPVSFADKGQAKLNRLEYFYLDAQKKIEAANTAIAMYESEKEKTYFLNGFSTALKKI